MDELAKTEARNYLSAAGFFLVAASFLLILIANIGNNLFVEPNDYLHIAMGIGLLIVATLLIVLRKRDMMSILFFMMGFYQLICGLTLAAIWYFILFGFLFLVALVTLTSKDKQKWLLFLIPLLFLIVTIQGRLLENTVIYTIIESIIIVLCLYYAFCCACERISLPGRKILTADETTDFKASGSVLGYMLFALISGGYAQFFILGGSLVPIEALIAMEILCGALMIFVAILLLTVGKMRFTPIMFLLLGLIIMLAAYSFGVMFIGIGILYIVLGLFAILRKESRILPGIMLIVSGCAAFFVPHDTGSMSSVPVLAAILNAIPCLIAIYLAFVVYSQRKLPKF